jgi:putative heme transporter
MTSTPGGPPDGPRPRPIPPWLNAVATIGWRLLAIITLAFVLVEVAVELSTVTATILVSLVATAALLPLARGLRGRGMGHAPAAAVALLAGVAIVAVAILALALSLLPNLSQMTAVVQAGIQDVRDALVSAGLPDVVIGAYDSLIDSIVGVLRSDLAALAGPVIAMGTVLILSVFLTFFMLQDGDGMWSSLTGSLSPSAAAAITASSLAGLERVGGYLRRTALLAAVDGVTVWVVLLALGVPLSGPLAALAFVAGFVPYLGAIVSGIVVSLAAFANGGPPAAGLVIAALVAVSVVSGRLLASTSLGESVDVSALLVLVAIPAGFILFGLIGLVALLPVVVFLLAIERSVIAALNVHRDELRAATVGAPLVPVWLDRLAQWSWRLLIAFGLIAVVILFSITLPEIVVSLVLALVLAATLSPAVSWLLRARWRPGLAAATAIGVATIAIFGALGVAVVWTIDPLRQLVATANDGAEAIDITFIVDAVSELGGAIVSAAAAVVGAIPAFIVWFSLVILLAFFFLRDGGNVWDRFVARAPSARQGAVAKLGTQAFDVLGGYMFGTSVISLFGAVTGMIIMLLLGLPLAVPVAILAFFLGFIPYIGSAIPTLLALLIAIAVGSVTDIVIMGIWTVVFNIVQGNFVTPLVYGRTFSLHPAIILLAIPAGNEIAGVLGMFLIVPFVAIIAATSGPIRALLTPPSEAATEAPAPEAAADP